MNHIANLPQFDVPAGTDIFGQPLASFNELLVDIRTHSEPDAGPNGFVYAHHSPSGNCYYIGGGTDPERPYNFDAGCRSKTYYEHTDWVLAGLVTDLPSNCALFDVTCWSLEQLLYDRMGALHFKLANDGRPYASKATNAEPWAHPMCRKFHQRLQWFLVPVLFRIYNEVPVRHGRDAAISEGSNPSYLKRVVTMAESAPNNYRQINRVTNWLLAAMGLEGRVNTVGNIGLVGYFNRNDVNELFQMHDQADWATLLDDRVPTDAQIEELYQAFERSVATNDGEIVYPDTALVDLNSAETTETQLTAILNRQQSNRSGIANVHNH
ncbi:hypothetical protein [Ferrimonas lipolytica]|uniref:Uncharacterized protein n=1 Tax=Ferrimonas lipolytica TaxID=2724191 RepID=A0A6H1UG60_9GAMM|nr:hypothetical protein [Ferrimonas lipolytica]QIZ78071.1 hypothetical protein HER31_14895 [Ferrimonas lipolytica]